MVEVLVVRYFKMKMQKNSCCLLLLLLLITSCSSQFDADQFKNTHWVMDMTFDEAANSFTPSFILSFEEGIASLHPFGME